MGLGYVMEQGRANDFMEVVGSCGRHMFENFGLLDFVDERIIDE